MAYEEALKRVSVPVNSDLSASQYRFVVVGADGYLDVVGNGATALGILQDDPDGSTNEDVGAVGIDGISQVEAGAAITAGDALSSDSSGRAVPSATGDVPLGTAMEDASGAGSIFAMHINVAPEPVA